MGRHITIMQFLLFNIVLMVGSLWVAYKVNERTLDDEGKKPLGFWSWANQGAITPKGLFVSLIFGIVFGFLDNFFLWMGIDKMMAFIPGHTLTKGAWGNTYSDLIGATVGASLASIGRDLLNVDLTPPIWINIIAMPIGCIMGMYAGMFITGTT